MKSTLSGHDWVVKTSRTLYTYWSLVLPLRIDGIARLATIDLSKTKNYEFDTNYGHIRLSLHALPPIPTFSFANNDFNLETDNKRVYYYSNMRNRKTMNLILVASFRLIFPLPSLRVSSTNTGNRPTIINLAIPKAQQ